MEELLSTDETHIENTEDETPAKPQAVVIPPHAPLPLGTAPLLDAQLGEALKIMRDFADWVHSPTPIEDCIRVSEALASLMTASATLATVSARLQKGDPESRHRMIVEYAVPPRDEGGLPRRSHLAQAGGSAKSRKRINRDKA
jgi:hypothetical protein